MDYFQTPDSFSKNLFGPTYRRSAQGVPVGQTVSEQTVDLINQMVTQLGLKEMGVYTPWGGQLDDFSWREIENPDTNVAVFVMSDELLAAAKTAMFGAPLPFLGVLTPRLPTKAEIDQALDGTNYELFQTQAVYRQDDPQPIPTIYFLHWVRLANDNEVNQEPASMDSAATRLGGSLLYAQQVPVESTTTRDKPASTLHQALESQFTSPVSPGAETGPVDFGELGPPVVVESNSGQNNLGYILLGLGAAAAAAAFVYTKKRK